MSQAEHHNQDAEREAVARAICQACEENPNHKGDARGNEYRWQDYLPVADAALAARRSIPQGDEPASPCPCPNLQLEHDDDTGGAFCIGKCPAQGDELPPLPEPLLAALAAYRSDKASYGPSRDAVSLAIKQYAREYGAACRAGRAKGE